MCRFLGEGSVTSQSGTEGRAREARCEMREAREIVMLQATGSCFAIPPVAGGKEPRS